MILQALHDYYQRKMADPDPARRLPAFGREEKEIPFILELTRDGVLAGVKDTRIVSGKKKLATRFLVPKGEKKTSGIKANLLWDNAEYTLGIPDAKKMAEAERKGTPDEYRQRLLDMHDSFKARIESLPAEALDDEGIRAVLAFLDSAPLIQIATQAAWHEITELNPVLTFRLIDDTDLVCQRHALSAAFYDGQQSEEDQHETTDKEDVSAGICLITGNHTPIERLHTSIKGVWGAQSSGANIVSFNLDAFNSFGKTQGANAPVSRAAGFAYTTALNHLLDKGSRQRLQVGNTSTVFWAQKADDAEMEEWFAEAFEETDDPDGHTEKMRAMLQAIEAGRFGGGRSTDRFFVLGLAPNAARISVRFWHAASLSEITTRTSEWFEDLRVARGPNDPEFPSLFRLLLSTAVLGKADNIPPALAGDVMRAALAGTPLPSTLMQAAVQRCRADQARKTDTGRPVAHVSYHRAALLKAAINRLIKHRQFATKEIAVSLDVSNTEPAYLFGRLFSAYERIQSDAARRELNRSVRDTYFGAAMSNPVSVFPRLIQLNQYHMRDLKRSSVGLHTLRDRLIGEIWDKLQPDIVWPATQPLAQRALFALGYYHQRHAFFTRADAQSVAESTSPGNN